MGPVRDVLERCVCLGEYSEFILKESLWSWVDDHHTETLPRNRAAGSAWDCWRYLSPILSREHKSWKNHPITPSHYLQNSPQSFTIFFFLAQFRIRKWHLGGKKKTSTSTPKTRSNQIVACLESPNPNQSRGFGFGAVCPFFATGGNHLILKPSEAPPPPSVGKRVHTSARVTTPRLRGGRLVGCYMPSVVQNPNLPVILLMEEIPNNHLGSIKSCK